MEWVQSVLSALGGGAVVSGAVIMFLKSTHEARIQKEMERLKSELSRFSVEHQIQFSHLHAKRAEAIAESYRLLGDVLRSAAAYTSALEVPTMGTREERAIKASDALQAARGYVLSKTIYFPRKTAKDLEELLRDVNKNLVKFQFSVDVGGTGAAPDFELWQEISERLQKQLPAVLESLSDDFRALLDPWGRK